MNSATNKPVGDAYSAHNSLKPTNFYCNAPNAHSVQIEGDFNHWFAVPMHRRVDGWWHIQILLCHGHHQYRFLIDGKPALDAAATGVGRDEVGEKVSLVAVS
jgi:1,4-alpha-glucan branching enzyme